MASCRLDAQGRLTCECRALRFTHAMSGTWITARFSYYRHLKLTRGRIKVMDESSYQQDRLLGWACYRLDRVPPGLRLLQLRGPDCRFTGGRLLVDLAIVKE